MDGGMILDAWNNLGWIDGILFTFLVIYLIYYGKCWIDQRFKNDKMVIKCI